MIIILVFLFASTCWSKTIKTTYAFGTELFFLEHFDDIDDMHDPPNYSIFQTQEIVNSLAFGVLKEEYHFNITTQPQKLSRHVYRVIDNNENELALIQVLPGYVGASTIEHDLPDYGTLLGSLCLCTVSFRKLADIKGTLLFGQYDFYQDLELQNTITFKTNPFAQNSKLTFKDKNGETGTGIITMHDVDYMYFKFIWD